MSGKPLPALRNVRDPGVPLVQPLLVRILCILAVVALAPSAQAKPVVGTEQQPELTDPANNIEYSAAHLGPQDHSYLDVLAAWLSHDLDSDEILFTVKVTSALDFEKRAADWSVNCGFNSALAGEQAGHSIRFNMNWNREFGFRHEAYVMQDGVSEPRPLKTSFRPVLEEPGYYTWGVGRQQLLEMGSAIHGISGACSELRYVAMSWTLFVYNSNYVSAEDAQYVIPTELPPPESAVESPEPWEQSGAAAPSTSLAVERTFAVGLVATLGILAVATLRTRRKS